mmetsp:Transcript_61250/g.200239  ORF Transcript_61250/g.200239 Transcript_61250/m.200239 type:complete len:418 (-) Transcript_61250:397-1650(-)
MQRRARCVFSISLRKARATVRARCARSSAVVASRIQRSWVSVAEHVAPLGGGGAVRESAARGSRTAFARARTLAAVMRSRCFSAARRSRAPMWSIMVHNSGPLTLELCTEVLRERARCSVRNSRFTGTVSERVDTCKGSGCDKTLCKLRSFEWIMSCTLRCPSSARRCSSSAVVRWGLERERGRESWERRELTLPVERSQQDLDRMCGSNCDSPISSWRRKGDAEGVRACAILTLCVSTANCSRNGSCDRERCLSGVLAGVLRREEEALRERARSAVAKCGAWPTVSCGCQERPRASDAEAMVLSERCHWPERPLLLSAESARSQGAESREGLGAGSPVVGALAFWRFSAARIASTSSLVKRLLEELRWDARGRLEPMPSSAEVTPAASGFFSEAPMFGTAGADGREAAQAEREGSN